MVTRPVLGIICCNRQVGTEPAQAVMERYVRAAMTYGDVAALLIPTLPGLMTAAEVAPRLDGILLTGTPSNIEAQRYGGAGTAGPYDPGRDAIALGMIDAMISQQKPIFGICRGFQEINVALGGTLRADAATNAALLPHHAPDGAEFDAMFDHFHRVSLTPGGVLSRALHRDAIEVNSVHFQAVDRLAADLRIEAQAEDGIVEAFSATLSGAPVFAVQWHPEWQTQKNPDSQAYFALMGKTLRGDAL